MTLRVFVACSRCHAQRELVVEGEWDVAAVRHDCAAVDCFEIERRAPEPSEEELDAAIEVVRQEALAL